MRYIIIVGGIALSIFAVSRILRRRRSGPMRRARKEMRRAVRDVEHTIDDLSRKATKLSGEAKETLEVQLRALESRRDDLVQRLQTAAAQGRKRAKKQTEREAAAATA